MTAVMVTWPTCRYGGVRRERLRKKEVQHAVT